MKWSFAVPKGPVETFQERGVAAGLAALYKLPATGEVDRITPAMIEAAVARVAREGVSKKDAATVTVTT